MNWLGFVRRHASFQSIERQAKKPVRLFAAGRSGASIVAALGAGASGDAVLRRLEDVDAGDARDNAARAIIHFAGDTNGDGSSLQRLAGLAKPVFDVTIGQITAGPPQRPAPSQPARYTLERLELAQMRKHLLPDVVECYGGLEIALASALPAFRPTVTTKLINGCAANCLKVAAASAVADHVPIIGLVLGGLASAGDTIAITGMQMNMLLSIAAAYRKKAEFARVMELLPVIGGGYMWRTVARELSGFIPVAGIVIKSAVAYAGTLVIGQAAAYYYENGIPMTAQARTALYREALDRATELAKDVVKRFVSKP